MFRGSSLNKKRMQERGIVREDGKKKKKKKLRKSWW
jgi:hypothetical protein